MDRASSTRTLVPTVDEAKPGPQASLWAPITTYRSKIKLRFTHILFTTSSWSQCFLFNKHFVVPASTKPLMTPKTLCISFSTRTLLTSKVITSLSSPSLLIPPHVCGTFWPPSCLWDADNTHQHYVSRYKANCRQSQCKRKIWKWQKWPSIYHNLPCVRWSAVSVSLTSECWYPWLLWWSEPRFLAGLKIWQVDTGCGWRRGSLGCRDPPNPCGPMGDKQEGKIQRCSITTFAEERWFNADIWKVFVFLCISSLQPHPQTSTSEIN